LDDDLLLNASEATTVIGGWLCVCFDWITIELLLSELEAAPNKASAASSRSAMDVESILCCVNISAMARKKVVFKKSRVMVKCVQLQSTDDCETKIWYEAQVVRKEESNNGSNEKARYDSIVEN